MLRFLLMLMLMLPAVALAEGDHDRALMLRHKGEILPLTEILQRLEGHYPGQALEVELKERKPHPVYEIEMLGEDGVLRELTVDAVDGHVIAVESD